MISIITRPADQIGVADLQELIDSQVPEGQQIEYKGRLSTRDGSPDPWMNGASKIGDRARNEILEESVAFANAYGGALVLGIAGSETTPSVAAEISSPPIPRCTELAERLKQVFHACVDPPIPGLKILPVSTEVGGDDGVVIIRT